jgi:hypothetical protein
MLLELGYESLGNMAQRAKNAIATLEHQLRMRANARGPVISITQPVDLSLMGRGWGKLLPRR